MRLTTVIAAVAASHVLAASAPTASAAPTTRALTLNAALAKAGVPAAERLTYRRSVSAAQRLARQRGGQTGREIRRVVNSAIRIARKPGFDAATAAVVFREVQANVDYLTTRPLPSSGTRVRIGGVVYERYWNQGLRIQPLGTYWSILEPGAGIKADGGIGPALEKAQAIAVPRGEELTLPYLFTWMGKSPTWRSAMAEGVAAAAAVRTWERSDDERYLDWAIGFGNAAVALGIPTDDGGLWYPLYDFAPNFRVLNGHVQTVLGLGALTEATGDEAFDDAFERGVRATRAVLARYDTGGWARYAPGQDAPVKYMTLQATQMKQLGALTGDEVFTRMGERWAADLKRPPVVTGPKKILRLKRPRGAKRAPVARIRIARDKPVTLRVAVFTQRGKRLTTYRTYRLSSGRSVIRIPLTRRLGKVQVRATATDWAGNRTRNIRLATITVRR